MKERATTPRGKRANSPEGLAMREAAAGGAVGSWHASVHSNLSSSAGDGELAVFQRLAHHPPKGHPAPRATLLCHATRPTRRDRRPRGRMLPTRAWLEGLDPVPVERDASRAEMRQVKTS